MALHVRSVEQRAASEGHERLIDASAPGAIDLPHRISRPSENSGATCGSKFSFASDTAALRSEVLRGERLPESAQREAQCHKGGSPLSRC